jgi:hypothetical protein
MFKSKIMCSIVGILQRLENLLLRRAIHSLTPLP